MKTNFREMLNTGKLKEFLGKDTFNIREKKAIRNIKYCANDQWQFVNSWYDCKDESARAYMMNADELFRTIYHDSLENEYGDGYVSFGKDAESFLKDVRFCGKAFLEKVTFYYVVKLLEESVYEVDGTDEDAERVLKDLRDLQNELFGGSNTTEEIPHDDAEEYTPSGDVEATLDYLCHNVKDGHNFVECLGRYLGGPVHKTRNGDKWIALPRNIAIVLSQYLIAKDSGLERHDGRTKITFTRDNVKLVLNLGKYTDIWSVRGN